MPGVNQDGNPRGSPDVSAEVPEGLFIVEEKEKRPPQYSALISS